MNLHHDICNGAAPLMKGRVSALRPLCGAPRPHRDALMMVHDKRIDFRLNSALAASVAAKARRERMSVPEYMRHLVRNDVRAS